MVSHWSLCDRKSPHFSWTLPGILADLNDVVVWVVSICLLISKSFCSFISTLVTLRRSPVTIGIIVTLLYHIFFFNFLARSMYLSFLLSFTFTLRLARIAESTIITVLFLLLITRSSRLAEIRLSVCISKSQRNSCISFCRANSGLYIYHLVIWSNLNFFHNFQWISWPTKLCLVLYSFCVNLLCDRSSLSPHKLNLLFCCILFILSLIWLILMSSFLCCYCYHNNNNYYCIDRAREIRKLWNMRMVVITIVFCSNRTILNRIKTELVGWFVGLLGFLANQPL